MSDFQKGRLIALIGVLILSWDTIFIRYVGADASIIMFWRGILSAIFYGLYLMATHNAAGSAWRTLVTFKKRDILCACVFGISNIAFIYSVTLTDIANTLLILGMMPLITTIIARIWIKEDIRLSSVLALIATTCGALLIFSGSQGNDSRLIGDICALLSACGLSFCFVFYRKYQDSNPVKSMMLAGIIGAIIVSVFAIDHLNAVILGAGQILPMFILGFIIIPISFLLIFKAPQYIRASEVSLIMLLESICASLLAWWLLAEIPHDTTIYGGVIILSALVLKTLYDLREESLSQ